MFFSLWVSFFSHFFSMVGARFICFLVFSHFFSCFSHVFLIFLSLFLIFSHFFLIVVSFFLFGGFIELTGGESS